MMILDWDWTIDISKSWVGTHRDIASSYWTTTVKDWIGPQQKGYCLCTIQRQAMDG